MNCAAEIEARPGGTFAGGPTLRGRNGDSGMSQLTEMQVVARRPRWPPATASWWHG
ncbi:hypothetical protein ACU4GD_13390 [Cupriavidus basilensis]